MQEHLTPGYYPDPDNPGRSRWWNGQGWSDSYRGQGADHPLLPSTTIETPSRPEDAPAAPNIDGHSPRYGKTGWRHKTFSQALALPIGLLFAGAGLAYLVKDPLLVVLAIPVAGAFLITGTYQLKNQHGQFPNPTPPPPLASLYSQPENISTGYEAPHSRGQTAREPFETSPTGGRSGPNTGRALRNAAITLGICVALVIFGILLSIAVGVAWGTPGPDGGTSLTGAPAALGIVGLLFAIGGFMAAVPATILTFALTLKRSK